MDLVVNTKGLVTELSFITSAFRSKDIGHRPEVLLTGGVGRLEMTFDDGRTLLKSSIPAEANFESLHTVQLFSDVLLDYLKLVKDKEIRLMAGDRNTSVWHDEGSVVVPNKLYIQHPRDILDQEVASVSVPREAMSALLSAGAFAAVKSTQPRLGGTLLQTRPDLVRMVATTGYVIAEVSQTHPVVATQDIVIPPMAFEQLRKLVKDADGEAVTLQRREKNFVASCGSRYFAMGVANGPFPMSYEKFFPVDPAHKIVFDAPMLSEAISRALAVSTSKEPTVDLTFAGTDITVTSGNGSETLAGIAGNANLAFTVNGQYLKGVLDNSPAPQIEMKANDPLMPLEFTPEWPDGQARYIVTTIRKTNA
jgi:DNA polymerase III sliding clamp (beta) subunit (PCNA family)